MIINPLHFLKFNQLVIFIKQLNIQIILTLLRLAYFIDLMQLIYLKENLASVVTSISKDHLDWLPKDEQTIEKIVFEKTSTLLNSNIIVAKQNSKKQ